MFGFALVPDKCSFEMATETVGVTWLSSVIMVADRYVIDSSIEAASEETAFVLFFVGKKRFAIKKSK